MPTTSIFSIFMSFSSLSIDAPAPGERVPRSLVGESQARPQRRPGTRIHAPHDRLHVVPAGIQSRNGLHPRVERTRVTVSQKARRRTDVAGIEAHCIERRLLYGTDGLVLTWPCGVAVVDFVRSRAAPKVKVYAGFRVGVDSPHAVLQAGG